MRKGQIKVGAILTCAITALGVVFWYHEIQQDSNISQLATSNTQIVSQLASINANLDWVKNALENRGYNGMRIDPPAAATKMKK